MLRYRVCNARSFLGLAFVPDHWHSCCLDGDTCTYTCGGQRGKFKPSPLTVADDYEDDKGSLCLCVFAPPPPPKFVNSWHSDWNGEAGIRMQTQWVQYSGVQWRTECIRTYVYVHTTSVGLWQLILPAICDLCRVICAKWSPRWSSTIQGDALASSNRCQGISDQQFAVRS